MARPADGTISQAAAPGALFREATGSPAFWTLTAAFAPGLCAQSVILVHQVAYLIGRGFVPFLQRPALGCSGMADRFGRRAYGAITAASGIPVALAASGGPTQPARCTTAWAATGSRWG